MKKIQNPEGLSLIATSQHRTGCLIACLRKMQGWSLQSALEEYRDYAGSKARALDEQYIDQFNPIDMESRINNLIISIATETRSMLTPPASEKSETNNCGEGEAQRPSLGERGPPAIKVGEKAS
jgi:hypothetical protein